MDLLDIKLRFGVSRIHSVRDKSTILNVYILRILLRSVCTPWPRAKDFPVRPSQSVNKYIISFISITICSLIGYAVRLMKLSFPGMLKFNKLHNNKWIYMALYPLTALWRFTILYEQDNDYIEKIMKIKNIEKIIKTKITWNYKIFAINSFFEKS